MAHTKPSLSARDCECILHLEEHIRQGLGEYINTQAIGIGVSGGADSIGLLTAVRRLCPKATIVVANVNHNIREEAESARDSAYVESYCARLNSITGIAPNSVSSGAAVVPSFGAVLFKGLVVDRGAIAALSLLRHKGIEEAARSLRYEYFTKVVREQHLSVFLLAHNSDDNIETVLMRFLRGSTSLGGMRRITPILGIQGAVYLRPMLEVSSLKIREYLRLLGVAWREDSTNADDSYDRNAIRHMLRPLLEQRFPWYASSLRRAMLLYGELEEHFSKEVARYKWQVIEPALVSMADKDFYSLDKAMRRALLKRALLLIGIAHRLPYTLIDKVVAQDGSTPYHYSAAKIHIILQDSLIYVLSLPKETNAATASIELGSVKRALVSVPPMSYSYFIREAGVLYLPIASNLEGSKEGLRLELTLSKAAIELRARGKLLCLNGSLPIIVRSMDIGDKVLSATGALRSVSKVLSTWHCKKEDRALVPIVQSCRAGTAIVAIWGELLGYPNWVVQGALL